jgi:hypothetical protein
MKIFSFGCSGEERTNIVGNTFVPSVPGKKPLKFISAGDDVVGGSLTDGISQGAGIAFGLILAGSAYAWVKTHSVTKAR